MKSLFEKFWNHVQKSDTGCWIWTGNISPNGYGRLRHSKVFLASRISWKLHFGSFDKNLCVLHKCDNRKCINPSHLFLGTRRDNVLDMVSKNRQSGARLEANGRSKLTKFLVSKIRTEYSKRKTFQYILGKKYGVSQPVISKIIRNESWVSY